VLVLHGGVDEDMTVEGLASLPRADYAVNLTNAPAPSGLAPRRALVHPAMRARMAEVEQREAALRPINSALWNDPMHMQGTMHNKHRGTGLLFGDDVVREFCSRTGMELVLRSHEQVLDGYEWPFGSGRLLATIFSASNYAGKTRNKGAYALLGPPGSTTQDRPFCSVAAASADAASAVAAATARRSPRIAPPTKHRDGADGDSSSNLPTDGAANGYGQGIWCETFAFGVLKIINFEAELIPALRDVHRTTHRLAALVFARRDELAAAYRTADKRGTGTLTLPMWAAETQRVLRLPFSVLQMRRSLLGVNDASAPVDYPSFLNRFSLARPQLAPLYPVKDYLLVLLYRQDEDGTGWATNRQISIACEVLKGCFGEHAPLCESAAKLLAALGPAGEVASRDGHVDIGDIARQFVVSYPDDTCPSSLVELMHCYDRDEVIAIAAPQLYTIGSPTRVSFAEGEQINEDSSPQKFDREERIARIYSGLVDSQRGSARASADSLDSDSEHLM